DAAHRELQPSQINWYSEDATNYTFKQDPGSQNSLGSIRINFPSAYGVYMHDTPLKNLFGDDFRFHSSGCVRVQNVRQLVVWLLAETKGWSSGDIDRVIKSGEQKTAHLVKPVPCIGFMSRPGPGLTGWCNSAKIFTAATAWVRRLFRLRPSFSRFGGLRPAPPAP